MALRGLGIMRPLVQGESALQPRSRRFIIHAHRLAAAPYIHILFALISLGVIYGAVFFAHAAQLGLYSDDWDHLHSAATRPLIVQIFSWPMDYRPFEITPWMLASSLLGHALVGYYWAMFVVNYLTALLLYLTVRRLCGSSILALSTAMLWAVYPADASVFWLTSIAYRLGGFFFMAALLLLLASESRGASRVLYYGSLACCILCLACNEIFLGLLVILPVVASRATRVQRIVPRLMRAVPFGAVIGLYCLYRLWYGPRVLHLYDNKSGDYSLSLLGVSRTSVAGAITVLAHSWNVAATSLWSLLSHQHILPPHLDTNPLYLDLATADARSSLPIVGTIAGIVGLTCLSAVLLMMWTSSRRRAGVSRFAGLMPGIIVTGCGIIGIMCGYAALAGTTDTPSIVGIMARLNVAATFGAAACTAGTLWMIAHALPLSRNVARVIFLLVIVVFGACAVADKERVQTTYAAEWTADRQVWRDVLTAVPALQQHTFVLLTGADIASGNELARLTQWGAGGAFSLLYQGDDVDGTVLPVWKHAASCMQTYDARHGTVRYQFHIARGDVWSQSPFLTLPLRRILVLRYSNKGAGYIQAMNGNVALGNSSCRLTSHPALIKHASAVQSSWRALVTF